MTMRTPEKWSLRRRGNRRRQEPGSALFQGLRIRLTLWYCSVLCAAMLLFGVALYFGAQQALISPVQAKAQSTAQSYANHWLDLPPGGNSSCSSPGAPPQHGPLGPAYQDQGFSMELVFCFNEDGSLLPGQNTQGLPGAFLKSNAIKAAVRSSENYAYNTMNVGGDTGSIYCYAQVVTSPGGIKEGVVLVGEDIQPEESALSSLLMLLMSIGGIALLGAGLGGLFLANRALAPARLAWNNQQRFIGDAAHELRTPLTLLQADAEVLLRGRERLETEDAFLLEDIVAETNHMTNITTSLLTLARLDNNPSHREHEVVNLAALVREGSQRVQALAKQREIIVQLEQTGNPSVIGDPLLLEQALLVVLHNAIKYNRQAGYVHVHVTTDSEHALLIVEDNGVGIAAEHLPYLGQRFYRADKARSREAGGTGLGLSIARSIAVAHGGQITLTSTPNQGTEVTLSFPLALEVQGARPHNDDQAIPEQSERSEQLF
jgi:signal transduction histidine kinase